MQSCPCPSCGAPLGVTLVSLRGVRCRSCGFAGPPPQGLAERLAAAERELAHLDTRSRQLDAHARAAIVRALRARWGALVALTLFGLPFVGLAALGVVMGVQHDGPTTNRVAGALFISVPMLVYATAARLLDSIVISARRRLLAACAAVPPEYPGEPAACAVCGAPLVSRGVDPIARCAHCAADNVVHPAAMAQASARRSVDLDALTSTLGTRAREIVDTARRAGAASVGLVVGTPFVAFASVLGILLSARLVEPVLAFEPSGLERYAWVDTKRGQCVGLIARDGDRTLAYFAGNDRLPNPSTIATDGTVPPRFAPATLIGRRLRLANGTEGTVRRVTGAPVTNREQVAFDGGEHGDLAGACAPSR
jgi:hypothetical protein